MKGMHNTFYAFILATFVLSVHALPEMPTYDEHPGSDSYPYRSMSTSFKIEGRNVDLYLPVGINEGERVPVIVYGHGQALNNSHYEKNFIHYAKKGVAIIFPQYDKNFFDQNWERMAFDFNFLTKKVLDRYSDQLDANRVVYSGHSKGAYVSLMAAGAPNFSDQAKSLVLFTPAGVNSEYLQRLNEQMPLSLIWGEEDKIIQKELIMDIYKGAPSKFKQFIEVKNYPELKASHFFMVSKRTVLGGTKGLSPYHFHGEFKWLIGAIKDLDNSNRASNDYLYGEKALESGDESIRHSILRNF